MFLWNGLLKGTNGMLWPVKYNSKSNNVWFISRWCFSLLFLACFATNISLTIFSLLGFLRNDFFYSCDAWEVRLIFLQIFLLYLSFFNQMFSSWFPFLISNSHTIYFIFTYARWDCKSAFCIKILQISLLFNYSSVCAYLQKIYCIRYLLMDFFSFNYH